MANKWGEMLLSPDDADLFFRLHKALMLFANEHLHVVTADPPIVAGQPTFPPEQRVMIRDALLDHLDLIDQFVQKNPGGFSDEELGIVATWRHAVAGRFIVFRQLKKHAVFLTATDPPVAYGVLGLTERIDDMIGSCPVIVDAVLLPFNGRIVHDGSMQGYNIAVGRGLRASFNECYREAKQQRGIVTTLPAKGPAPSPRAKKQTHRRTKPPSLYGRWRIVEMEMWDQAFVNAEVEGYVRFDKSGRGEFHFGYISGRMDCELIEREGRPGAEWTWQGSDEMNPASGRGWAVIGKDGTLRGKFYLHGGDTSEFKATY